MPVEPASMTEMELMAFSEKLEAFAEALSPREQEFLAQMLADARDAATQDISGYANLETALGGDDDVQGFGLFSAPATIGGIIAAYAAGISEAESEFATIGGMIQEA
jgi:hypothetical protein